ncbi:MAG: Xaa-Pro peptidase family protein [Actinomycetota bacterium]
MLDTTIDPVSLRSGRLARLRSEMATRGVAALVLTDPVNIRYASGARNMQIFTARNPARYLFVAVDGPVVLHEFTGALHLADGLETITEVRPATTASFVAAGDRIGAVEQQWAAEIRDLVAETVGLDSTVGVERVNAGAAIALGDLGLHLVDAQAAVERARAIKTPDEIACQVESMRATERAMAAMEAELRPGLTENELWSVFHQHVIAQGGDYIETRLLSSGPHTNPWFQETSAKVIERGELVAFDTDVVGCHGYYADYSRTFHAGPDDPSAEQRELYRIAHEQVHHNLAIIEPGLTFAAYSERAWDLPARFEAHRYYLSAHGVGMTGEYPYLYHAQDFASFGYDGVIEPGMTLCVESFIGGPDTREGVKLEQQVLVTDTGTELLSHYPFDERLLG